MSLSANKLETETVANGYAQRANILLQPDSSLTKTKSFFYKATLHKNKAIFQSSTSTQKRRVKKNNYRANAAPCWRRLLLKKTKCLNQIELILTNVKWTFCQSEMAMLQRAF